MKKKTNAKLQVLAAAVIIALAVAVITWVAYQVPTIYSKSSEKMPIMFKGMSAGEEIRIYDEYGLLSESLTPTVSAQGYGSTAMERSTGEAIRIMEPRRNMSWNVVIPYVRATSVRPSYFVFDLTVGDFIPTNREGNPDWYFEKIAKVGWTV